MSGFFDQNPEFAAIVSDKDQDVLDAIREKSEQMDRVRAESLVAECLDCGTVTECLLGWCTPCHDTWKANYVSLQV